MKQSFCRSLVVLGLAWSVSAANHKRSFWGWWGDDDVLNTITINEDTTSTAASTTSPTGSDSYTTSTDSYAAWASGATDTVSYPTETSGWTTESTTDTASAASYTTDATDTPTWTTDDTTDTTPTWTTDAAASTTDTADAADTTDTTNTTATTRQIFYGRFISAPTPDELVVENGAVLVVDTDGRGTIQQVAWNLTGPEEAPAALGVDDDVPVIEAADDGFFFPGFIDSHLHAPQFPNLGLFEGTLLDWLQTYTFPMEASLGNPDSPAYANFSGVPDPYARAVQVYTDVVQRTLAYGTTTASYFATIDVPATNLLAKLAFTLGQRAFVGRVCMDDPEYTPDYYRDESAEEAMNATWANIDYIRALDPAGDLVAPIVTPRFAPAVTPDTLTWLGQLAADENLRVQTHIAENVREVALVADMFPDQPSYAAVYDAHGLLTNRTILAHGVHLTDDEMGLIAARGAKVSHCPASNSALGSGICPTRKLLDMGVEVGLGTDLAGGYSASVLEVARQAFLVSRLLSQQNGGDSTLTISVAESLYLATVGGAQVVSMPGLLGAFEPGMRWDVQEIVFANDAANLDTDADAVELFDWESWSQRAQKWFWHGDDRNVHRVWVGGRLVHQKPQ